MIEDPLEIKKKRGPKKGNGGRPEITIDMEIVDDFLVGGANGAQIAAYLGICDETLYERVAKEFGISFSDYSAKKKAKGDAMLHVTQFKKAIKGDNTQLVWLGKNRLGQREHIKEETDTQLIVKTVQYIESQRDNPPPQLPSTEVPTTDSPSA